jgi:integrase
MDAILEAYIGAQRRRRRSPLTIKATAHALGSLQRWLDEQGIAASELSLFECERYFDELLARVAVSTVRRHLAYVRAAYRYGLRHQLVGCDPTLDVKLPWLPDIEPATYSNQELRAILAATRTEREELAFFVFAFAGLRLGELAALRWQQVDLDRCQLRLTGKGGKFRLIPLHPALHRVLLEYRRRARHEQEPLLLTVDRRRLAASTLGRTIRALVDRAEVEVDAPAHAFRRTVATVMHEQGVRTRVIERIMGWAPRQMHERHYLRVADQAMRAAILTLYRDDPICPQQLEPAPTPPPSLPEPQNNGFLAAERQRLEQLERELALRSR